MHHRLTLAVLAASCLLGSLPGPAAEPLGRELRRAAEVQAMVPLCLKRQPKAAELYIEIIEHWWEQNGAVREALRELAHGSLTPEGLERQIAFEELVRQLQDAVMRADPPDLVQCCAEFMAGLAARWEPAMVSDDPCAAET